MSLTRTLSIGPVVLTFNFSDPAWDTLIQDNYNSFLSNAQTGITITLISQRAVTTNALKVTVKNNIIDIRREDFHSRSNARCTHTELTIVYDKYSLNSWLRIFLSVVGIDRNMLLIHGAGYHYRNETYLFPGRSGAGKSTITRLLGKKDALSDELTLLHLDETGIIAYSTPFWGELQQGGKYTLSGKLKGIFTLRHGKTLSVIPSDFVSILRALLITTLFFAETPSFMKRLLRVSETIARSVDGFEMTFPKNASRINLLKSMHEALA